MSTTPLERLLARCRPLVPARFRPEIPVVPVVRLHGAIGISTPFRPGLTLAGVARALDRAFAVKDAVAVALLINSPGGSAVQSHLIHTRIRGLAAEKNRPVIAFVEDVAASGGYMLACAADEIVADPASIVGSIGVIGASFGFNKLMKRIGVERRVHTAGDHKAMLDPFKPESADDVARLKAIQASIHADFIELVKDRRGAALSAPDEQLFSGEFWTGTQARGLGLVDHLGEVRSVLRERFGDKVTTPLISAERGWFGRRLPFVGRAPVAGLLDDVIADLEARALWGRYGL